MASVKYSGSIKFRVLGFSGCYILPVLVWSLAYVPPIDFEFVYQETLETYPNYDFEPYLKFGGLANARHICMTFVSLSLVFLTSTAPIAMYYWRRETLKILNGSFTSLSKHTVAQFKMLIQGLSIQIMIPLVCYVPVAVFYVYNKYSGSQIIISQYTLAVMITLPAAWDPILLILFISPYRNAVKAMWGNGKVEKIPSPQHTNASLHSVATIPEKKRFARWRAVLTVF